MGQIPASAAPDVQQAFREVWQALRPVLGQTPINPRGQAVVNAGESLDPYDLVTRRDLDEAIGRLTGQSAAANASDTVLVRADGTLGWLGRTHLTSPGDGILKLATAAGTSFLRLLFGGQSASFPALKRVAATLAVRLADDSDDADLTAKDLMPGGGDDTGNVGDNAHRWNTVRAHFITPGDLVFENGWAVTEADQVGLGNGLVVCDAQRIPRVLIDETGVHAL